MVEGHKIVERVKAPDFEQRQYDLTEMLILIDGRQPESDQLGAQFLLAEERPTAELKEGERVFIRDHHGEEKYILRTVLGHIDGTPYVDRYPNQDNAKNPNSRLKGTVTRIAA